LIKIKTISIWFYIYRPCGKSKSSTPMKVNGVTDNDEDISLKEDDIF
jgi:hypothetical protein